MDKVQQESGISGDDEKQCLSYFKSSRVWEKILKGFWKKYESYGVFSGSIKLTQLTIDELEELEGFFGTSFHGKKSVIISSKRFGRGLKESRFAFMEPERLLELYFHKKPMSKKEREEGRHRQKEAILQKIRSEYKDTPADTLFDEINGAVKYDDVAGIEKWQNTLRMGAEIINNMPYRNGKMIYLAVFATQIIGNPHAFDNGSSGGNLLRQMVELDLKYRGIQVKQSAVFSAFRRQKSYLSTGIMIDDVSNYAILYGIRAIKKDGCYHAGIDGFMHEQDIVQVPLAVIAGWQQIDCPDKRLYIVENPSVFSILCEQNRKLNNESGRYQTAFMCMNGQPRLAGLIVLELCAKSDVSIYYAGDFDPEGLLIAQKLSTFFEGDFNYWHMSKEEYLVCRSEETISERRLKMLEKITDERLRPLVEEMRKYRVAGYQEGYLIEK